MRLLFAFTYLLCVCPLFPIDLPTKQRLKNIESKINELEKRVTSIEKNAGLTVQERQDISSIPQTTGEELLIKEDILKAKIASIKTLSGKKKKGLLIDVVIYNPGPYKVKVFAGDLLFYSPSGEVILTYKAYDDKKLAPKQKTIFPVLVDIEKSEAYFYFVKNKTSNVTFKNQRIVADDQS